MKISINYNGSALLKAREDVLPVYWTDNAVYKNGNEIVEMLIALWQESQFITIDSPLSDHDLATLTHLRKVSYVTYDQISHDL